MTRKRKAPAALPPTEPAARQELRRLNEMQDRLRALPPANDRQTKKLILHYSQVVNKMFGDLIESGYTEVRDQELAASLWRQIVVVRDLLPDAMKAQASRAGAETGRRNRLEKKMKKPLLPWQAKIKTRCERLIAAGKSATDIARLVKRETAVPGPHGNAELSTRQICRFIGFLIGEKQKK